MTLRNERGAVLIHIGIALLGLVAFSSIVMDYGVMWVARGTAQTSADSGALAGARSLALNAGDDDAREAASLFSRENNIFNQPPAIAGITVTVPYFCPPPYNVPPVQACVKVDLVRQDLPTFFGRMVGVNAQGVRATATAMAGAGNSTSCLRPWFIPDAWEEKSVPANTTFEPGTDVYRLPFPGPGTGYTASMIGTEVTLTAGDPKDAISSGNYYQSDPTGGGGGTTEYQFAITNCINVVKQINDGTTCPLGSVDPKCMNILPGRRPIPSAKAAQDLIDADPYAYVNATTKEVVSGCAPHCVGYEGLWQSPRLVPVALFDPQFFYDTPDKTNGNFSLPIKNIMGFFVKSAVQSGKDAGNITGQVVADTALSTGFIGATGPANFLKTQILVR